MYSALQYVIEFCLGQATLYSTHTVMKINVYGSLILVLIPDLPTHTVSL